MKFQKTLLATAAAAAMVTTGTASALSLGQVYVTDQKDGVMYIYDQTQLNTNPAGATPAAIDLVATSTGAHTVTDGRNHLIAFNNVSGLDPQSRITLAYLKGELQIRKVSDPSTPIYTDLVSASTSLHMCGGNPANTEIMCSSIGGLELVTYSTDYSTDSYAKSGTYPIGSLVLSSSVKGKQKKAIEAEIEALGLAGSKPICNNYSTDGSLAYVTLTAGATKGVIVLDTSDMTIVDALSGTAVGCGLVNSPDGESMWTNAGSNSASDDEKAYKWDYSTIASKKDSGPSVVVDLPEITNGDVHGAQFAGLGGSFLWELMRLDNKIYVIDPDSASIVNTLDMASLTGIDNLGGDVLDRSAFGTRMYMTTRGYAPITAIGGFIDAERNPGVTVVSTIFGFGASSVGHSEIRSGELGELCIEVGDDDGDHDHEDPECPPGSVRLDNADPHGLKSLNYTSGGF